ncbi:MAG: sugar transferase [Rhizobiaceae bacterium]|nr:sugar transferase [Rhizobiaceae bacterium]
MSGAESRTLPLELHAVSQLSGTGRRWSIYPAVKRAFDIAVTLAMAPAAVPLVGLCAMLVRRDGASPFYSQPRLGKNGKEFLIWKLRTMVPNADKVLASYLEQNPEAKAEWDAHQKLANDPRITRIGRFLRKYSIDEFPQLFNVFVGDMSLVGPRPMCPDQRQQYPGTAYFELRPGMTGLWQISERNQTTFAERAIYDNRYAGALSLATDMRILVMTPLVVLRGTGL